MKNLLLGLIVIAGLGGCLAEPAMATADEVESEKGFAPAYVGAGVTTATDGDASASEFTLLGAYRATAIDEPVSVRGYLLPVNGVEFGAELSYDFGVAEDTNVYPALGFVAGSGETFPTLGLGAEYLFEDANVVLNTSYRRALGNDGFNLFQFGTAYQF